MIINYFYMFFLHPKKSWLRGGAIYLYFFCEVKNQFGDGAIFFLWGSNIFVCFFCSPNKKKWGRWGREEGLIWGLELIMWPQGLREAFKNTAPDGADRQTSIHPDRQTLRLNRPSGANSVNNCQPPYYSVWNHQHLKILSVFFICQRV